MRILIFAFCLALLTQIAAANVFSIQSQPRYSTATNVSSSQTSYQMIQYSLPNGSKWPFELAVDKQGHVWVVEQLSNQLGMFNPMNDSWKEYSLPTADSTPNSVTVDSSGNVWVTGLTSNRLVELRNGSTKMIEYQIPNGTSKLGDLIEPLVCGPVEVYTGPDQNIWILCDFSNQIDEYFPVNSTFAQFDLPLWESGPVGLVFDHSGNFWFTAANANMLGHASLTKLQNGTSNGISEFAPKNQTYSFTFAHQDSLAGGTTNITSSLPTPAGIGLSPDGTTLWITEHVDSSFDSYNIASKSLDRYWLSKTYMEYGYPISFPNGLAVDSSGNVWMAEHYGNKIAEFNPGTRSLTEYAVPCCSSVPYSSPGAGIYWLTLGNGGSIWFVEIYGNRIGEIVPTNGSQGVNLNTNNAVLSANLGQHSSINLPLQIEYAGLSNRTEMKLAIAGTSANGTLVGVRAQFNPVSFNVSNSGMVSSNLTLDTQSLKPGIYDLTISANLTSGNVIYSAVVELKITSLQFPTLILDATIIGIVASAAVVVIMNRRQTRKRRRGK